MSWQWTEVFWPSRLGRRRARVRSGLFLLGDGCKEDGIERDNARCVAIPAHGDGGGRSGLGGSDGCGHLLRIPLCALSWAIAEKHASPPGEEGSHNQRYHVFHISRFHDRFLSESASQSLLLRIGATHMPIGKAGAMGVRLPRPDGPFAPLPAFSPAQQSMAKVVCLEANVTHFS